MNKTLVEVIQFLDSNGHSNTDVRKKVDTILNFTNDLKEESKMELTKIKLAGTSSGVIHAIIEASLVGSQ